MNESTSPARIGSAPAAPQQTSELALHLWLPTLLQLTDTFYPTGSYAHSFGLEGLVQDGFVTDRATLRTFLLEQALPALAQTDLVVAAAAWAAAGEPVDWDRLEELGRLGSALRGAREPREASDAIGRQRLEMLAGREDPASGAEASSEAFVPDRGRGTKRLERSATLMVGGAEASKAFVPVLSLAGELKRRAAASPVSTPNCLIAAVEARTIGAPVEAALAALIYGTAAALLAAAVKLLRLGQNAVQSLLTEALALAPALIAQALATSLADAGSFTPWWDVCAARHERADFRLFIS